MQGQREWEKQTKSIKVQDQQEVKEGNLTSKTELGMDTLILFVASVINCADQVKHKTKRIKIIVIGAEKFLDMKDLSWEQINRRLEEDGKPCSDSWGQDLDLMIILQWNARSVMANGQEFEGFIQGLRNKPEIICIHEPWLKTVIRGFDRICRDRVEEAL